MGKLIIITILSFFLTAVAPANKVENNFDRSLNISTNKSMTADSKGRLKLIYFWATWCPDCKQKFKTNLSQYQTADINFMTLSIEDNKDKISKFVTKEKIQYPVYFDPERTLQKELKIFSVPTVVLTKLVDGKTEIIRQVSGKDWADIDQAILVDLKSRIKK